MQLAFPDLVQAPTAATLPPDKHDIALAESFASYQPKRLRTPRFFTNSRINSFPSMTFNELFTGRALRNIELLLAAIDDLPSAIQESFRLSLTAALGQMSKMVFAITGRGKTTGVSSERMEVGSWVIGYWRPEQHFEVNVWTCFERRVQKLIKAVSESESAQFAAKAGTLSQVSKGDADHAILNGDCLALLPKLPDNSVDLVITDPPHGDRIPYLELSELWNVILGETPPFEAEIVVSNAKERSKKSLGYNQAMTRFLEITSGKLRESGCLVLFFNARTEASWKFLNSFSASANTAGNLRPELTLLKRASRTHRLPISADLADAALLQDSWAKVSDHPSAECRQLIAELVNFRDALVTAIEQDPTELIRRLYENQGDRRFDASNRLFLVLVKVTTSSSQPTSSGGHPNYEQHH